MSSNFKKSGWIFIKNDNDEITQNALKLKDKIVNGDAKWYKISGGYYQCNINTYKSLRGQIERYAKDKLELQGISTKDLCTRHFKLLHAPPGAEEQAAHRDGISKNQYVVAFYLSENRTTDVSYKPYPEFRMDDLSNEDKKQMDPSYWDSFINFKTQPGDMMIFAEDVVHRGIRNATDQDRYVLFTVLGPIDEPHTDKYQEFEWSWNKEAYGFLSAQHLDSLVKNKRYRPLAHATNKKEKIELQRALKKHKLSIN